MGRKNRYPSRLTIKTALKDRKRFDMCCEMLGITPTKILRDFMKRFNNRYLDKNNDFKLGGKNESNK